jgi:hypothetical protein
MWLWRVLQHLINPIILLSPPLKTLTFGRLRTIRIIGVPASLLLELYIFGPHEKGHLVPSQHTPFFRS